LGVQIYEEEQFKCAFSEMEEGMEEIPKEILNAIDSLNEETDKKFLGFE
jgi:hypothetical protein